jgi:hypothetical protein
MAKLLRDDCLVPTRRHALPRHFRSSERKLRVLTDTVNPVSEKVAGSAAVALAGRGARASLEEADTHIQTGSCQANAHDDSKTANHSDHVHNVVNLRFGNGRREDFGNRFHVTLQS